MIRSLFFLAFLLGAGAIIWMAAIFAGTDALAFTVTIVIAAVFCLGGVELLGFRQATTSLRKALDELKETPESLDAWINKLSVNLRNATQARIEGERVALPAPVLTPYLVGLLVMLGLLGTFIGMVDTLQGAVTALESNSELQAIRAGLAAPIQGLGLAFGTSVAGVAASAMLGLMSTLSRRERILETQRLDRNIATSLRAFSLTHSRQETYRALQQQADTLPAVAERLDGLAEKLETMGEQLGQNLVSNQENLNTSVTKLFSDLANSVQQSLTDSVTETVRITADSGRLAGESLKPVMQETLSSIQNEIRVSTEGSQKKLLQQAEQSQQLINEKLEISQQQISDVSAVTLDQLKTSAKENQQQLAQSTELTLNKLSETNAQANQALQASTKKTLSTVLSTVEATQQSIDESNRNTQKHLTELSEKQLQSLAEGFGTTASDVAHAWSQGLDSHQQANQELMASTRDSLKGFSSEFARLSADLLANVKGSNKEWINSQSDAETKRAETLHAALDSRQQQAAEQLLENNTAFKQQLEQQASSQQEKLEQLLSRFEETSSTLSKQWQQTSEDNHNQQQALSENLQKNAREMNQHWLVNAKQMLEKITLLMESSEQLLQQRIENEDHWMDEHQERMNTVSSVLGHQLEQLREQEQGRADAAINRLGELESAVASHLSGLGQSLEAPMTRLIETASQAPRAAAEVIEHLRAEISKNIERDNGLLSERRDVLVELNTLSESIQQTAEGQQQAIETLVSQSTEKLDSIGVQFNQQVSEESNKLNDMVALFAGSSAELSSLGEAFGVAVEMFRDSNNSMLENLTRIESSLNEAGSRSDEQLGYYVAQAREIIDQSVVSQQQMLDGLRQLREEKAVN